MSSLILLRGLPGSGKSSLAKILSSDGKFPVFSVDDFFTNPANGEYKFEFEKNHLAYALCEENTRMAMKNNSDKILVDNTFTQDWEMEPYFSLGKEFGYRVFVVTVENHHGNENIHGIGREQIEKMAGKFCVKLF